MEPGGVIPNSLAGPKGNKSTHNGDKVNKRFPGVGINLSGDVAVRFVNSCGKVISTDPREKENAESGQDYGRKSTVTPAGLLEHQKQKTSNDKNQRSRVHCPRKDIEG